MYRSRSLELIIYLHNYPFSFFLSLFFLSLSCFSLFFLFFFRQFGHYFYLCFSMLSLMSLAWWVVCHSIYLADFRVTSTALFCSSSLLPHICFFSFSYWRGIGLFLYPFISSLVFPVTVFSSSLYFSSECLSSTWFPFCFILAIPCRGFVSIINDFFPYMLPQTLLSNSLLLPFPFCFSLYVFLLTWLSQPLCTFCFPFGVFPPF